MKTEIKEIPFENGTLLGVRDENGKVFLAVKKACLEIGLNENQARAEIKKVQTALLFQSNCVKFDTVQAEGDRKVKRKIVTLSEDFVPMWLAQINLTPAMQRKNPEAVKKLLKYQLEATKVLHSAFYESDKQKQRLHNELELTGEIVSLKEVIQDQSKKISELLDYTTINYQQQQSLLRLARQRINDLLGGAHSPKYKKHSRIYFKNIWIDLCNRFRCGSYKDLNPSFIEEAKVFLNNWDYALY